MKKGTKVMLAKKIKVLLAKGTKVLLAKRTKVTLAKGTKVALAKGTKMTLVLPQSESKSNKSRHLTFNSLKPKTILLQGLPP